MVTDHGQRLLAQFVEWAKRRASIQGVILFGSRARDKHRADRWSDVDLQVVTSRPALFYNQNWTRNFGDDEVWAYAVRAASGGVRKATVAFRSGAEIDFVVVPAGRLRELRLAVANGSYSRAAKQSAALNELATVMRRGFLVLKGDAALRRFYARVVRQLPGTRLGDAGVRALGEEFKCEWLWIRKKIARGEFLAAQRVLHRSLAEINFRLLHELRLRRNQRSFRDARRLEVLLSGGELAAIAVEARLTAKSIREAANQSARTFGTLMQALFGPEWRWPELPAFPIAPKTTPRSRPRAGRPRS